MKDILIPFGLNDYCVNNTCDFKTGDFITARVKFVPVLFHRGIVVVDDDCVYIYHNSPKLKNDFGGSVVRENIEDWLKTRDIISIVPTDMTKEYIEQTSLSLAEYPFDIASFNCEHFAFYLKDGSLKSPQLTIWSIVTGALFFL